MIGEVRLLCKKALTWCVDDIRITCRGFSAFAERNCPLYPRTKERGYRQEIHVQGCHLDEQSVSAHVSSVNRCASWRPTLNPDQVQALEECVESQELAERKAYKKSQLSQGDGP